MLPTHLKHLEGEIISMLDMEISSRKIADKLLEKHQIPNTKDTLGKHIRNFRAYYYGDKEILAENVKLAKHKQKNQDLNRIERKAFREHARIENAITQLNEDLIKLLKKEGLKIKTVKHKAKKQDRHLVLQLSDLHLNTLVDTPFNKFDFDIASKRLKKLAGKVIQYGKDSGCEKLFIAFTGDIGTSGRRMDEILNFSTNLAKATQISIRLLSMFLIDLNSQFNIECAGVCGNEPRVHKDIGWTDIVVTDNYDFNIYDSLKIIFENKSGFKFQMMKANEAVVNVNGKNFLLMHGHQIRGVLQKKVSEIIGKYSKIGIAVDFALFGDIHSAYVSDFFARNSSIIGGDDYASEGLGFTSRASQNVHAVFSDSIDSFVFDLQTYGEGYPIGEYLESYQAKSVSPTVRVVIENVA